MHGELIEFNELLQRQLICCESRLKRLTAELVSLRGPVSLATADCPNMHLSIFTLLYLLLAIYFGELYKYY